jgi:hypothetical protein
MRSSILKTPVSRAQLLVFTATLAFTPIAAHAQFGGMIKRAAEKVAGDKVAEKATSSTTTASKRPLASGEALTQATLAQVIKGVAAAQSVMKSRDALVAKRDADQEALDKLHNENEGPRNAYDEASSKIGECREAHLDKASEERSARIEKNMGNNPETLARMQAIGMKYAKIMAAAQERKDSLAYAKAQFDMQNELSGVDILAELKKDSAAADTKCGRMPQLPASLAREEQLEKGVSSANDEIRTLEAQAINKGADASGLDRVQYLLLKERTLNIMNRLDGRNLPVSFQDSEMELVKQQRAQLDPFRSLL